MERAILPAGPRPLTFWAKVTARLPASWTTTRRRRRIFFLALCAPGFFAVFGTPVHRNLFLTLAGFMAFALAIAFRLRTEPLFAATTDDVEPAHPMIKETPHA